MNRTRTAQLFFPGTHVNKILAIKTVRNISSCGLKEAKYAVEAAVTSPILISIDENLPSHRLTELIHLIKNECKGEILEISLTKYRDSLEEIAVMATLNGDTYAAKKIMEFINDMSSPKTLKELGLEED